MKSQIIFDKNLYYKNGDNKISTFLCYIIDRCNQNCKYCYNNIPRTNKILNLTLLENFILKYKYIFNTEVQLLLFGGEPTLHSNLLEFCTKMDKLDVKCNIISNFSQSIDFYFKFLSIKNITFDFSWHSTYNDNINFIDKIQQIPFEFVEQNKVNIIIMYEQEASQQSLDVFNKFNDKYKKYIDFAFVNQRPIQNSSIYNYIYTLDQLNAYNNMIKKYKIARQSIDSLISITDNQITNIVTTDFSLPNTNLSNFKYWKCNAGKDQLYIHFDGDVSSCAEMFQQKKLIFGNIYNKMFDFNKLKYTLCKVDKCACPFYSKKIKIFK